MAQVHCKLLGLIDFFSNLGVYGKYFIGMSCLCYHRSVPRNRNLGEIQRLV